MPKITPEEARALMVQDLEPAMETIYSEIRKASAEGKIEVPVYGSAICGNRFRLNAIRDRLFREGFIATIRDATDQRDETSLTISWRVLSQDDR